MDWLTEGTTWDVVQEWRKRFPNHSDSKITTPEMREVLAGAKVIVKVQGKAHKFVITSEEALKKHNEKIRKINREIKETVRKQRERVMTEKQFEKKMKEVAQDLVNDKMEIDQVAYDVAENLWWDSEIRRYTEKYLSRSPWDARPIAKEQVITFIAESINL